jgi:hypothetical protein
VSITTAPHISDERMPWPVAATALTALLALHLTAGLLPLVPIFAALILTSYATRSRLNLTTTWAWLLRLLLLFLIIALNPDAPNGDYALGTARNRNIFAQFYTAEMALQFWLRRPSDPARARMVVLLMSGLVLLTASNTFEERYIQFITPVYLLFLALALPQYRTRSWPTGTTAARATALLIALIVGGGAYWTVQANRARLTEWGNRIIGDRFQMEATGMASQPMLGSTFGLRGSPARVLRIQNFVGDPHLRGMAFDTYVRGRWSPAFNERPYKQASNTDLHPAAPGREIPPSSEMTVTRLVSDNPVLYAPLATVGIDRGDAADTEWSPDSGGPIRTRARPPYDYTVTVASRDAYQGILALPLTEETHTKYLQVPADFDPRLRDLARKITADAKTPIERVGAVVDYLMSTHRYSLSFSLSPGTREPIADFLLSEPKKAAHCEYFAASAAMLLRCVGVPTRYVTGYYAHESGGSGITIVRGRDAHAWCEAWVDDIGWITADATPGDGRPDADTESIERWRQVWEWLQDRFREFATGMADLPQSILNTLIGVVVGGFALYGFVRFMRQRRTPAAPGGFAYSPPDPRIVALIPRFEAVFARQGAAFPPQRTYREHLDSLGRGELAGLAEAGQQFVRYYDAARFGSRLDEATADAMRRLIEEMETKKDDRYRDQAGSRHVRRPGPRHRGEPGPDHQG